MDYGKIIKDRLKADDRKRKVVYATCVFIMSAILFIIIQNYA